MSDKDLRWGNVVALGALVLLAAFGCVGAALATVNPARLAHALHLHRIRLRQGQG